MVTERATERLGKVHICVPVVDSRLTDSPSRHDSIL
jgi:hypothetical protein